MLNITLTRSSLRLFSRTLYSQQQQIANMSSQAVTVTSPTLDGKYIATHDGVFHCDEVTACFMLKKLPTFKDHAIVRTRDESILNDADIVVDVGGVFDSAKRRFDHHQRTFQLTIRDFHTNIKSTNPNRPIRLSSAGLIYAHYGKDFIREVLKMTSNVSAANQVYALQSVKTNEENEMSDAIYAKFYSSLMEEIDAIDNGVEMAEGENFVYNYNLSTHLAARVDRLNPGQGSSGENRLKQFHLAMSVVGEELIEHIERLATSWWPSLDRLTNCVLNRHKVDESGAIVEVPPEDQTIWRSALLQVEERLSIEGQIKYVLFSNPHDQTNWRIMAVPVSMQSFQSRLPLKEEWRGLQDEELCKKSGISNATFVHATGFTGGASNKEGCIALARKTMESVGDNNQDAIKDSSI